MRTLIGIVVVLGVAAAAACSDRHVEPEDAEARRTCDLRCERLYACGIDFEVVETVEECSDFCLLDDISTWQWKDCRAESLTLYACVNALSCDDLIAVEDHSDGVDPTTEPCWDERGPFGHCYNRVRPHADGG